MFTQSDLDFIQSKGIDQAVIDQQLENFKTGFPFAQVQKAATIGDGLIQVNETELNDYINAYNEKSRKLDVYKFVLRLEY